MRRGLAAKTLLGLLALVIGGGFVVLLSQWNASASLSSAELEAQTTAQKPRSGMVAIILTSPGNQAARDAMRYTWLAEPASDFQYLFMIGTKDLALGTLAAVTAEAQRMGDVVFLPNVNEAYGLLTAKVLEAFIWVNTHRPHAEAVLKIDDDTFVRKLALLEAFKLHDPATRSRLYWGYFDGRAPVRRTGKWAEPHWFLSDTYLPYALGGGYVVGGQLVDFIARNHALLSHYVSEDVSVGAWLAPLNITRVHDVRFDTEWKPRGCLNHHIVSHKQSPDAMRQKASTLQRLGVQCEVERRERHEYEYQWHAPPSQCCPGRGKN